ncbi:MAG: hypothetical protein IKD76_01070 [Clostridia bacterium]|nr:hypothetical protein [Clostridia bacterium]
MEVNFFNTMDEIIERLEENDFETYAYNGNLFHIIDKNECIDFQIKFGINNYYIKDNENKKMYMFVKKYLDETTTVQTILYNNNNEQFYYSFLEKDGNIRMAKLIRKCGDEYLLCSNTELLGKTDTELLKYAYENLNSYEVEIDENGIVVPEFNKDELCNDEYGENYMEDYSEDDEENEEFIDEEDEEICNVSEDDLLENFEEITISEFVNSIYEQAEEGSSKYYKDKEKDLKLLSEFYAPYEVLVNGEEQEGLNKILIAQECELITELKYFSSIMMREVTNEVNIVLNEVQKNMEGTHNIEKNLKTDEDNELEQ